VVVLLQTLQARCQILNIDKTDTADYQKKPIWQGRVMLGLLVDKEKRTLVSGNNFVDVALQNYRELFIISSSDRFNYNGPTTFLNTGYAHFRWRHNYKNKLHVEGFTQFQWDANRGLRYRYVVGGNLRYNLWHKKAWEMTLATGFFAEKEQWDYSAVDSAKIPNGAIFQTANRLRSNSYIKWEGSPTETSHLAAAIFYQGPLDALLSPRIAANINFTVDVSKHFSLGILYSGIYDSKPVVPIANFYYSVSNNLLFKF